MYTYGQLNRAKVRELKVVAEYFGINVKRLKKGEIIDKILEHFYEEKKAEEVQKSVRIRRIEELNK